MFLLYFRFSPNDGILVLLTPIAMKIGIPYVIPLSAGLFSSPVSALAAAIGTIVFYFLSFISENGTTVSGSGTDELISSLRFILDGLMKNRTMVVMAGSTGNRPDPGVLYPQTPHCACMVNRGHFLCRGHAYYSSGRRYGL
jgi:hypothetical protein